MESGGAPAARTASANCRCGAADELPQSGFGGNSSTARGALEGDSPLSATHESPSEADSDADTPAGMALQLYDSGVMVYFDGSDTIYFERAEAGAEE